MKRPYVLLATILFAFATTSIKADVPAEQNTFGGFSANDFAVPLPEHVDRPEPTPTPNPFMELYASAWNDLEVVEETVVDIELEYLGTYYITSYCPEECGGSWSTASGETCHRADWEERIVEPTTCAIDPNLHSFGDLFYIAEFDRVFVAEDTGSAVKGKHLDLFYEDYEDVYYFPTGYYEVYSVEYVYTTVQVIKEKEDKLC